MGSSMKKYQVFGNSETFVKAVIEKDYTTARKEAVKAHKRDVQFQRSLVIFSAELKQFEKNILYNFFNGNVEECIWEMPKVEEKKTYKTPITEDNNENKTV